MLSRAHVSGLYLLQVELLRTIDSLVVRSVEEYRHQKWMIIPITDRSLENTCTVTVVKNTRLQSPASGYMLRTNRMLSFSSLRYDIDEEDGALE